ncbi:MAG: hypothetical protein HY755_10900 [Nitrospirae bacterium]|nr:hypothetical protein [Nitrospirota bacterium]
MKKFLNIFRKTEKTEQADALKEAFRSKYLAFQDLLAQNNNVLIIMADMEEKLSGEFLFDRHYIDTNVGLIIDGVSKIIKDINDISNDNKYIHLYKVQEYITKEIGKTLSHKLEIPVSGLTMPVENLNKDTLNIAGGKITHLGEIKNRLRLPTPDGFSITAYAFKRFMEHNKLSEKINERLSLIDINNLEEINKASKEIQDTVIKAEIPSDLQHAIKNAVESLKLKVQSSPPLNPPLDKGGHGGVMVSVRSSAILEDSEFSFAGQYATFLNVPEDMIAQRYKEVIASLFTPRAIFYYKTKGFSEEEMIMAVGVLIMINARAGGVIYTRDPNDPEKDKLIINAVWGLGKSVVDGTATPHSFIAERGTGNILDKKIPEQQAMLLCTEEGDIKAVDVPDEIKNMPCLNDEEIKLLTGYADIIEKHYGSPQDIEWVIDQNNQLYILQSRPLRTFQVASSKLQIPRRIEKYNILLDKGVIAYKGIGYGKAFVLQDEEGLRDFPEGAVLVAKHTSTKFVTVMNKASAIVTDVGGSAGHMASLSREYQIPTILNTETATAIIKDGQELTVDAINCNIYEGRVTELLDYVVKKKEPFKDTHLFRILEKGLKWIVPLSLVDPEDEKFKPEYCRTFHDITRFAHEKAMQEMFLLGEGHDIKEIQTIDLKAGIPLYAHLLDIGGGVKDNVKKATATDISSIPFSAFLSGMTKMRWPEPRPADVKGFIGMMAHTATIPEEQLYQAGEKSFALISDNYMNFSIRLGYHFSMVEAYSGENINDNYIRFFFKGGGAAIDRRLRRIRLITEIIKRMDFKLKVTGDVIDAMLTKYKQSDIEKRLEIMGKLTAYTKQLDMVMYNDAVTDMFIDDFVRDHMKQ